MKKFQSLLMLAPAAFLAFCGNPGTPTESAEKQPEAASSQLKTEIVTYTNGTTEMKGYFAYDAAIEGKRPGILVVHEWWGQNDYVRHRAEMLGELGYVAMAVDMYGDGATADHPNEAMGFSSAVMQNMPESKARFEAAYAALAAHPMVDAGRISAVGYCFGGSVALSMANAGMELDGVAAFHSGVTLPIPPGRDLVSRVLVQNGADDPFITAESANAYKAAMDEIGADLEYVNYPGVLHAFTNPGADAMGEKFELPLKYDAEADAASWEKLKVFLDEMYKQ